MNTVFNKPKKYLVNYYKNILKIGHGKSGDVYKIESKSSNSKYAIKFIDLNNERNILEINILKNFKDCNKVINYVKIDTFIFNGKESTFLFTKFSSRYIPLSKLINIEKLDDKKFKTIIDNLLNGLLYIHSKGVAHRDIKPNNVLINIVTLNIKYIDFGFSCYDNNCHLSKHQKHIGTYKFMSPKIFIKVEEKLKITFEDIVNSDLFSFGMSIIFLLTKTTFMSLYMDKNNETNDIRKNFFFEYNYNDYRNSNLENKIKNITNIDISKLLI